MKKKTYMSGLVVVAVFTAGALILYANRSEQREIMGVPAQSIDPSNQEPSPTFGKLDGERDSSDVRAQVEVSSDKLSDANIEIRVDPAELEEDHKRVRDGAASAVKRDYTLMFDHLGLSPDENEVLYNFLVDVYAVGTRTKYSPGIPMDEEVRQQQIAEIIGQARLEKLLELEVNRKEYRELGRVQALFESNDVPLTDSQREGLFEILVKIRGQDAAVASPNAEPGSMVALASRLVQMNEYERLVLELAPAVLTSEQVEHLFNRYQDLSYKRSSAMDAQQRARVANPDGDQRPLYYPPRK